MNDLLITAPSALYACKPGGPNDYCHIYAARGKSGNEHWDRLLQIIGREDLITNPKFASPELRHEHADEMMRLWKSGHGNIPSLRSCTNSERLECRSELYWTQWN